LAADEQGTTRPPPGILEERMRPVDNYIVVEVRGLSFFECFDCFDLVCSTDLKSSLPEQIVVVVIIQFVKLGKKTKEYWPI